MSSATVNLVTTVTAVATGLAAGVYAGFSTIVMPALRSGPAADALTAMQRINVQAVHPGFMLIFWTGAVGSVVTLVLTWIPGGSRDGWTTAAAALSLLGFAITVAVNVPRNNVLAQLDPMSPEDLRTAGTVLGQWVLANHVRALASIAALVAFLR